MSVGRYGLLVVCCLVSSRLSADSIPTLTATSLTLSTAIGSVAEGEVDQISGSGPTFTLAGEEFIPGTLRILVPIGVPLDFSGPVAAISTSEPVIEPGNFIDGMLAGNSTLINYLGEVTVTAPANSIVVLPTTSVSNFTVILSGATAMGSFSASSCGTFEFPPNCTGPQVANIAVDLTGIVTLTFSSNPAFFGEDQVISSVFSTTPEPSTVVLVALASVLAVPTLLRRGKASPDKNNDMFAR